VQGKCFFGDTWHVSRGSGRLHEGTDIGAAAGKNVYAVADGRVTKQYVVGTNQLTGNGLIVRMADGTYFFYAHLMDFAPGIGVGTPVKAGQIIGYVGSTGNSSVPHLHFEVHPKGGSAVNPYPLLKAINGCGTTTPPPQP
jgi:murein DD-endopeptidase MepM/ murein hydrolase activator NlpD